MSIMLTWNPLLLLQLLHHRYLRHHPQFITLALSRTTRTRTTPWTSSSPIRRLVSERSLILYLHPNLVGRFFPSTTFRTVDQTSSTRFSPFSSKAVPPAKRPRISLPAPKASTSSASKASKSRRASGPPAASAPVRPSRSPPPPSPPARATPPIFPTRLLPQSSPAHRPFSSPIPSGSPPSLAQPETLTSRPPARSRSSLTPLPSHPSLSNESVASQPSPPIQSAASITPQMPHPVPAPTPSPPIASPNPPNPQRPLPILASIAQPSSTSSSTNLSPTVGYWCYFPGCRVPSFQTIGARRSHQELDHKLQEKDLDILRRIGFSSLPLSPLSCRL
jgi:hypothetical protein